MIINTKGIVLKTLRYGETSIITHIFTLDKGLKSFIVNGVRNAKAAMPLGLFQPCTLLFITMYTNEHKKLLRMKEAKIFIPWQQIPFDIRRSSVALFICEMIEKTLHESEEHTELFEDIVSCLKFLDQTESSYANLPMFFMIKLSEHYGFGPQGRFDEKHSLFDLQEGLFVAKPTSLHVLSPELSAILSQILDKDLNDLHLLEMSRGTRRSLTEELIKYFSLHIENLAKIKSLDVFQSIMEI